MVQVVADQVRLWQADTQRVKYFTSTLYHDFPRPEVSVWSFPDPCNWVQQALHLYNYEMNAQDKSITTASMASSVFNHASLPALDQSQTELCLKANMICQSSLQMWHVDP